MQHTVSPASNLVKYPFEYVDRMWKWSITILNFHNVLRESNSFGAASMRSDPRSSKNHIERVVEALQKLEWSLRWRSLCCRVFPQHAQTRLLGGRCRLRRLPVASMTVVMNPLAETSLCLALQANQWLMLKSEFCVNALKCCFQGTRQGIHRICFIFLVSCAFVSAFPWIWLWLT